jgi:hypothetical protein
VVITVGDIDNGKIMWSLDGVTYNEFPASGELYLPKGFTLYLKAVADPGYGFSTWYGDIDPKESNPYMFDGSDSIVVDALFFKDGAEGTDYVVIKVGDCEDGKIQWSLDGENYYDFPASGELYVDAGTGVYLKAEGDGDKEFIHWKGGDVKYTEDNPFLFDGSESIVIDAVFSVKHPVTIDSDRDVTLEYTIIVKDPVTGEEFVYERGTIVFGPDGGAKDIFIPDGATLQVRVVSDTDGYNVEWDDGNPLTRQTGPLYSIGGVNGNLKKLSVVLTEKEDVPFDTGRILKITLILLAVLIPFLIIWAVRRPKVVGRVTRNGMGVENVTITYTVLRKGDDGFDGPPPARQVTTKSDGKYVIYASMDATVEILDIGGGIPVGGTSATVLMTERVMEHNFGN